MDETVRRGILFDRNDKGTLKYLQRTGFSDRRRNSREIGTVEGSLGKALTSGISMGRNQRLGSSVIPDTGLPVI